MRRLLIITALLSTAVTGTAGAATNWVVSGGGWGHGLGMSQYGAFGYAQHGRDYRQILSHYYQGTKMSTASRDVRVLLQASIGSSGFSGATRAGSKRVNPDATYSVTRSGGRIVIRTRRGKVVARKSGVITVTSSRGVVSVSNKGSYRDAIEFRPGASGGVTSVNKVDLEDYVKGVVPNESPSSWPIEALKAQAVAARSYAISTDKSPSRVFDHYDTTSSQVYRGYGSEVASTNRAVAETSKEVLRFRGEVATTYFFSTSGGHTENNENVWGGAPVPYLRGVRDPYDTTSPYHRWRVRYSSSSLGSALGVGNIQAVEVVKRGASPRIVKARISGTGGSNTLHGQALKTRLGLRDAPSTLKRISSRAGAARAAAAGVASRARARDVKGQIEPVAIGSVVVLQRHSKKGWKTVARSRTRAEGAYRIPAPKRGVYRVVSAGDPGPSIRVR